MNRKIALLLAAVLSAGLLASCGSAPTQVDTTSSDTAQTVSESSSIAPAQSAAATDVSSAAVTSSAASKAASSSASKAGGSKAAATASAARTANTYTAPPATLTGTITLSGSTSIYPLAAALQEAFNKKYPRVKINITNVTGSGAGEADALAGRVSFGMRSSVYVTGTNGPLVAYTIAKDGVAFVVNKSNPITNITAEQLEKIYNMVGDSKSGLKSFNADWDRYTKWSDLGGNETDILAVSREDGSGTRSCFQDVLKALKLNNKTLPALASGYDKQGNSQIVSSTDAVLQAVENNPKAIGYMSLGSVTSAVKKLTLNGQEATHDSVQRGTYDFSRPFNLLVLPTHTYTKAEIAFLHFILSDEGQRIATDHGFVELTSSDLAAQQNKIPS